MYLRGETNGIGMREKCDLGECLMETGSWINRLYLYHPLIRAEELHWQNRTMNYPATELKYQAGGIYESRSFLKLNEIRLL